MQHSTQHSTTFDNPAIPEAQPHLQIRGKLICQNLLPALRHEIVFPPYCNYLQQKLQWNASDAAHVHWEIFTSALQSYHLEDQRHLVLFTNNKLPLQASNANPHPGSTLCPSCQHEPEEEWHFLEFTHTACTALFQTLHRQLTQLTQQLHLHPCILTTIWLGLVAIQTDTHYPDIANKLPPPFCLPIAQQTHLGWDQLYHGRLSHTWATVIDETHPTLDMWALRNQHLHQNTAQLNLPDYHQAAMTLYEQNDRLPRAAQDALFWQPLEHILNLPAPQLEQWVIRGHKYYNQQMKAAKNQAKLSTHDIRTYFAITPHQSDDLQPP